MLFDFIAGCLGGMTGVLIGHPLDTVKVNMQVKSSVNPHYHGTFATLYTLFMKHGIKTLYRGVTSPLVGLAGINALVFGVYHNMDALMHNYDPYTVNVIAGGLSGFVSSFLLGPIELAKSRMQVAGEKAGHCPLQVLLALYKQEGFRAIFRGTGLTIIREVPGNISYFLVFHYFTQPRESSSTPRILVAGGLAGMASWAVPYPADVVKSKIQVDGLLFERQYKDTYDCFIKVLKNEGVHGLYVGIVPTLIRAFPVNALIFAVVTWSKRLYDKINSKNTVISNVPDHNIYYFKGL